MVEQTKAPEVTEASQEKQKETPNQIFDKAFNKIRDKPLTYSDETNSKETIVAKNLSDGSREIFQYSEINGAWAHTITVKIDKTGMYSARFEGIANGQRLSWPLESGNALDPDAIPTVGHIMEAIDRGFQINTEKNLAAIKQKENLTKQTESPDKKLDKDLASL